MCDEEQKNLLNLNHPVPDSHPCLLAAISLESPSSRLPSTNGIKNMALPTSSNPMFQLGTKQRQFQHTSSSSRFFSYSESLAGKGIIALTTLKAPPPNAKTIKTILSPQSCSSLFKVMKWLTSLKTEGKFFILSFESMLCPTSSYSIP